MRQLPPMVSPVHEPWIPAPRRQQNQQRYWWSCSGSTAPNSLCKIFTAEMQLTCKPQKCWRIPELATCSSCCCIYCSFPERLALPDTQRRRRRPVSLHQPRPLERRKHFRGIEISLKWYCIFQHVSQTTTGGITDSYAIPLVNFASEVWESSKTKDEMSRNHTVPTLGSLRQPRIYDVPRKSAIQGSAIIKNDQDSKFFHYQRVICDFTGVSVCVFLWN